MSVVLKAIEATIGPDGRIETSVPLHFDRPTRVILTIAIEEDQAEPAALSERAWAADWDNPDEDEAWASLQEVR
jgi:hypothetical protein